MPKWQLSRDPDARIDDDRHTVIIPSRAYLTDFLNRVGRPLAAQEICEVLGISEADGREGVQRRLRAMERDGQLICNRAGGYGLVDKMDLVRGRVQAHRDGYGFLTPDEGGTDLFLSPRTMRSLMHGDRILVRLSRSSDSGRAEAKLVEILERNTTQVVGRYFRERGVGFVYPERRVMQQDLLIPPDLAHDAQDGQMVVARLVEQPSLRTRPVGEIVEIIGDHMAPGLEIDVAIRAHGIPDEWPESVLAEVEGLSPEVPEADKAGRVDLRALPLMTIDGSDAKDFDDAVYCKPTAKGWRLLVAIADVSAYVQPGSALDREASRRGNSTYFPGRVVPMLPEVLSNGLCSLNPRRDRLCMVCEMNIDQQGEVFRSRFYEAVMHSHARLTYEEVAEVVQERSRAARDELGELVKPLDDLHALYKVLAAARERRGCLEFESTETQIMFGPARKIDRIVPVVRNDAHRLIEECMIAANVCAARFLQRRRLAGLYRVHEQPKAEKITDLRAFLGPLGLKLGGGKEPESRHLAALGKRVRDRADAPLIQSVMLRSLPQAQYTARCDGHFGLALDQYTHFTSPIRRYPDLIVHRAIKHGIGAREGRWPGVGVDLAQVAEACSTTERRSDDASRDVLAWLKCEYVLDKLGEDFAGTVSGVAPFGIFVQLDGIYVEGLVHVSGLGQDYFHHDAVHHRLSGERTGVVYTVGTRVKVRVVRVDLDERKVDFELLDAEGRAQAATPRAPRGAGAAGGASRDASKETGGGKKRTVAGKRRSRRRRS